MDFPNKSKCCFRNRDYPDTCTWPYLYFLKRTLLAIFCRKKDAGFFNSYCGWPQKIKVVRGCCSLTQDNPTVYIPFLVDNDCLGKVAKTTTRSKMTVQIFLRLLSLTSISVADFFFHWTPI